MSISEGLSALRRGVDTVAIVFLSGSVVLGATTGIVVHRAGNDTADPSATPSSSPSAPVPGAPSTGPAATSTPAPPVGVPRSASLDDAQFVVPRGPADAQQLDVSWVNGSTATRRLKTPKGHRVNSPTLSADRRTIIYIDRTAGHLRTIAADGTGDRILFRRHPAECVTLGHVSWNRADQNRLVLRCTDERGQPGLFVVTLAGELIRRMTFGDVRLDDPAVSPDGTRVAFWMARTTRRANGGGIFTMPLDGSTEPTALTAVRSGRDADPSWSPDGRRIAFRRSTVNSGFDVYAMNADGSDVRRLVGGPATDEKPAWSPDSTRLLAVSDRADPGRVQSLFVVSAAGGKLRAVGIDAEVVTTPVWASR